jgi:beta-galactosidase
MVNLDGTPTPRSRDAGDTARRIAASADLWTVARPVAADVAIVFNPLVPLLGGEQAYGDRRGMHRAVAGYHRMFFERNVPVEIPSARELSAERLRRYKLVIVPYPILMTREMADALSAYARAGGHLFVEARPGWQDERGHASPILPGFGWHEVFGIRETQVEPVKRVNVSWAGRPFAATGFVARFDVTGTGVRTLAAFEDGAPAVLERAHGAGRVALLASFAGEQNQLEPVAQHPLADALLEWAGVARLPLESTAPIELRRMTAGATDLVMLFNHGETEAVARVPLASVTSGARLRELTGDAPVTVAGTPPVLLATIPPRTVRVYRSVQD